MRCSWYSMEFPKCPFTSVLDVHDWRTTYIHTLTPFLHGGRQKLHNATCYDPYTLLSPRLHSNIWSGHLITRRNRETPLDDSSSYLPGSSHTYHVWGPIYYFNTMLLRCNKGRSHKFKLTKLKENPDTWFTFNSFPIHFALNNLFSGGGVARSNLSELKIKLRLIPLTLACLH